MADSGAGGQTNRLKCAFDAGFLSAAHPPDSPSSVNTEDDGTDLDTNNDAETSNSPTESNWSTDLSTTFQVLSESLLRMESTQMEMAKAREVSRLEAERRRTESEDQMTQLLVETQLQIAEGINEADRKRKRKRVDEEEPNDGVTERRSSFVPHMAGGYVSGSSSSAGHISFVAMRFQRGGSYRKSFGATPSQREGSFCTSFGEICSHTDVLAGSLYGSNKTLGEHC